MFVVDVIFEDSEGAKRNMKRPMLMLMLILEILLLFALEISSLSIYGSALASAQRCVIL